MLWRIWYPQIIIIGNMKLNCKKMRVVLIKLSEDCKRGSRIQVT